MEIIRLKNVKNYRDLGGLKTIDNREIKPHMLIRGTTLFSPGPYAIVRLKESYNLKTIIDLRTKKEMLEKPDVPIEGVEVFHMPIIDEAVAGISHEKRVHSMKSLVMMPPMTELYVQMVTKQSLDNLVKVLKFILTLPQEKYAVAFHCTAGKDRTGVVSALLLSFLGVDRATIIKDYMLTNPRIQIKANLAYIGLLLTRGNHKLAHKIKHYFMAEPDFIKASLNQLEKDFGSLENFFKQKMGFSEAEETEIKNKFLR
ncbi:MAG: tyrosine-protein phosphatase [Treponema sp.]|nr:tyrosine-protein phosphatase [Treponema sp.]